MDPKIYLVGGYQLFTDETCRTVYELNLRQECWTTLTQIPRGFTVCCGAVISDGGLYVVAGHDGVTTEFSQKINRFDLSSQEWSEWPSSFSEPLFINGLAVTKNEHAAIFCSGDPVQQVNRKISKSNVKSRVFSLLPSYSETTNPNRIWNGNLSQVAITPTGTSVLTCGGYDEKDVASTAAFLLDHTQPTRVASMSVPRGSHGLVTSTRTGRAYAIGGTWISGGRHSHRTCEAFDADTNRWIFTRRMAKPRRDFAAASSGNQIFVFGGFHGVDGIFFDSEVYDERSGNWRSGPAVPPGLWNYTVAA
ncbi:hypothetical protein BV898_12669 [Hypsibius exemplaris]|uniref:Uncharacterized protein n=1 Tax=Hypsibius exemplaris TaxID=2072580 RepID=A0A1W0WD60_HYPEX|nr:hypothetical protein BV898_12669 [Hypsibius exemplaris]